MEYELLGMENESLKLELSKYISAAQKKRGDTHDSGDFNCFSETSIGMLKVCIFLNIMSQLHPCTSAPQ